MSAILEFAHVNDNKTNEILIIRKLKIENENKTKGLATFLK